MDHAELIEQAEHDRQITELTRLPHEILLHILSFLESAEIAKLQNISRDFRDVFRDNPLWRSRCFEESSYLEALHRRRQLLKPLSEFQRDLVDAGPGEKTRHKLAEIRGKRHVRIMANWDPSYPSEKVDWYDEYIQRHAPIAVNWLQQPQMKDGAESAVIEARGVALYYPGDSNQEKYQAEVVFAVSPLDDGSVCLWDITGAKGRKGAIYAKSKPGILFVHGPTADNSSRANRVDSGVTECVSVDSKLHRAFFAVQSHLIEVDLQRLVVVGFESFPWSITSLSKAHPTVPLTVGTSLGIHIHDYRSRTTAKDDGSDKIDDFDGLGTKELYERSLKFLFDNEPLPPYAPLSQPGPLSILHTTRPGAEEDVADEIYVAGRFPSILLYDRRMFPSIKGTIHSGARLSSLTSLPHPFSSMDSELRREGQLSVDQVLHSKTTPDGGRTLIACGEYNTKGSLEMYGLQPSLSMPSTLLGGLQDSVFKNRQTCSDSKLLSVINHGTRLVFSDGSGRIKWFERDGFTEVRCARIGHCERAQAPSLFASMPGSDDMARKLLSTQGEKSSNRVNTDDLLFWTGENLGLVSFTSKPGFTAEDFEEAQSIVELEKEEEERKYDEGMRKALKRQADDVRFVKYLGQMT